MSNGRVYDEFRDALCGRWRSTCPTRTGNDHAIVAPYGMFRTSDGEVALMPSQEQSYQRLVDAIGAPEEIAGMRAAGVV
ncbi:MAG TPA: hypothetical protein DHU55_19610 [Blastocatellia bacterium]|nr:hypothetical protein [Blastocatellia bacterium]